ncbi:tetratricopeptide repeat-containing sensor histidine kinase [Mucilaginibacter sp.]|jgi:signal transduction histidine kinase/Tfp pilus assembly protein PilF|uniref:tetratricopeptide repeat-containing sensor histidine kinase n=1 Tax=Mucilaginibacter sp. TaxID=1882438 RepID=UPI002CBAFE1B|nr:tetratricopeptide repeat-containing sensor histidine kinase [Mucilaginibacter sp.]HTI57367.1 tetratricopeptide repeat-containing sensor histidine kinase [Mucilaginibacter sp.]
MAVLKYFISLLLMLAVTSGFAAGEQLNDTSTVNRLNKLAAARFSSDPDTTFYYANQAINIAREINYETGIADGLVQAGHVDYVRGKSESAVKCFDEAIAIYKKLNNNAGLAACYLQYGRMCNILADYSQALKYLNMALAINKQANDEYALTDSYKNIGIVYFSQGKLSEALDYYYKGLFIAVKNHYREFSADLYNDIGVILQNMEVYPNALEYYKKSLAMYEGTDHLQVLGILNENIGEVLVAQHNYEKAIVYLNKANNIAKKQSDQDGLSSVYTDLGLCYAYKKDFPKALSYLDTSLRIAEKYKIVYNQAYAIIGFATVYNMQKDYRTAYPYAVKGQQIGVKLGNLSIRVNAALELNKTLAGLGRINDAYKALNEYLDLKTKLKDNESIQKLTSYNFELSFAVKQRLLAEQQHEKDLLYKQNSRAQRLTIMIFLVVIMAMVVITGIYYNEKRKQQRVSSVLAHKNSEILQQKADMDTQAAKLNDLNILKDRLIAILAHDLRAPLSTLRGLFGLLQDDSISHEEMLSMIPDVLKKLDYTSDFLDTLLFWINSQMENFDRAAKCFPVKEIVARETEHYYEQAQGKGITLIDSVPQELNACADPDSVRIVVRNLITNAIKFSRDKDVIEVSAKRDGDNVLISIKDTGEGMTAEQSKKLFKSKVNSKTGTHNESGTGMGLLFCKDLIEKSNGTIWVTSKPGKGSNFFFTLPSADAANTVSQQTKEQAIAG